MRRARSLWCTIPMHATMTTLRLRTTVPVCMPSCHTIATATACPDQDSDGCDEFEIGGCTDSWRTFFTRSLMTMGGRCCSPIRAWTRSDTSCGHCTSGWCLDSLRMHALLPSAGAAFGCWRRGDSNVDINIRHLLSSPFGGPVSTDNNFNEPLFGIGQLGDHWS